MYNAFWIMVGVGLALAVFFTGAAVTAMIIMLIHLTCAYLPS